MHIKGHNFVTVSRKKTSNNPKLNLVNVNAHTCTKNLVKFSQFILKILSGNEILTSIKGHNSVTNLRKMMFDKFKLNRVNVNVHTESGQILSIHSQDIDRKRILTRIKGHNSVTNLRKKMCNNA